MSLHLLNFKPKSIHIKNIFNLTNWIKVNFVSSAPTNTDSIQKKEQNLHNVSSSNASIKFPGYKAIYVNHYAHKMSLINRLKFYQSILYPPSILASFFLEFNGYVPEQVTLMTILAGFVINLWPYQVGLLTNDAIGIIYYNDEEQNVIISYITFWGKRRDLHVPAKEIYHFTDLPNNLLSKLYRKVIIESHPKPMKFLHIGRVFDEDQFSKIFGDRS